VPSSGGAPEHVPEAAGFSDVAPGFDAFFDGQAFFDGSADGGGITGGFEDPSQPADLTSIQDEIDSGTGTSAPPCSRIIGGVEGLCLPTNPDAFLSILICHWWAA
jgi:hypothetical protein